MNIQNAICHDCIKRSYCREYWAFRDIQNLYDLANKEVKETFEWLVIGQKCPHKKVKGKNETI